MEEILFVISFLPEAPGVVIWEFNILGVIAAFILLDFELYHLVTCSDPLIPLLLRATNTQTPALNCWA